MSDQTQDNTTVLGPDANFKGELTFEKNMRIHGRIEGKINTGGRLHVAREAKINADVDAGSILVEGEVHGALSASDRIELKNTAHYEGDLRTSKLIVEEGAVFSGHVSVGPEATKPATTARAAGAAISRPVPPSGLPNRDIQVKPEGSRAESRPEPART